MRYKIVLSDFSTEVVEGVYSISENEYTIVFMDENGYTLAIVNKVEFQYVKKL